MTSQPPTSARNEDDADDGEPGGSIDVGKAKVLETRDLDSKDARWLKLTSIKYADPTGRPRLWECAERTTKPSDADVDAVGVVALVRDSVSSPETTEGEKSGGGDHNDDGTPQNPNPFIILIRQFRPPASAPVIELPAGLLDPSESPLQCAIRELREETGFVASEKKEDVVVGPKLWNDPGMVRTSVRVVRVVVDLDDNNGGGGVGGGNKKLWDEMMQRGGGILPRQGEDGTGGEFMEVFAVRLADLPRRCREWDERGVAVDARVGGLAEGWEMAVNLGVGSGSGL